MSADSSFKIGDCVKVGGLSRQSPAMRVLFVNDRERTIEDMEFERYGSGEVWPGFVVCGYFGDGMVWYEVILPAAILEFLEKRVPVLEKQPPVKVDPLISYEGGMADLSTDPPVLTPDPKKWEWKGGPAKIPSPETLKLEGQYQSAINGVQCSCSIEDRRLELIDEKFFWCRACYLIAPDANQTHSTPEELADHINDLRFNWVKMEGDDPVDHLAEFDDDTVANGQLLGVSPFDAVAGAPTVGELKAKGYVVSRKFNGTNYFWSVSKAVKE